MTSGPSSVNSITRSAVRMGNRTRKGMSGISLLQVARYTWISREGPVVSSSVLPESAVGSGFWVMKERKADRCLGVPSTPTTSPSSNAIYGSGLGKTFSRRMMLTTDAPVLSRMSACAALSPISLDFADRVNHSTSRDFSAFRSRSTSLASVRIGQKVTLTLDALGKRELSGQVSKISLLGATAANIVSVPVTIDIDSTDAPIYPGLSALVSFQSKP